MIAARRLVDGTTVYDCRFKFKHPNGRVGMLHGGTFRDQRDAEAMQAQWMASLEMDRKIVAARAAQERRSLRRAQHLNKKEPCGWSTDHTCPFCDEPEGWRSQVRYGGEHRPRQAGRWMDDPVGEMACWNVDREREAS